MQERLKYILFIFLLWLYTCSNLKGQVQNSIDSLKIANKTVTDKKEWIDNTLSIADLLGYSQPDSAISFANKALKASQNLGYQKGEAKSNFLISFYNDQLGNTDVAIKSMQNAIKIFTAIGDSSFLISCYNNLGVLYSMGSSQEKSFEYFVHAKNISEAINEPNSLSEALSNIGSFYEYLEDYSSALKYYQKALEIDIKTNNIENIALSYIYIGSTNLELHRYDKAFDNFSKAEELLPQLNDKYRLEELYINFSDYYLETGNLQQATYYLKKAKILDVKNNYPFLKSSIFLSEGRILQKQKKYKNSLVCYQKALELSSELKDYNMLYDLYKNKSDVYFELGKHSKAYGLLQKANDVHKKIKTNLIAKLLGEFEHAEAQKEEKTHLKLEQELQDQKNKNTLMHVRSKLYFTIFLAIFLGTVLVIALYFYALKRNNSQMLESNYELINHQKKIIEDSYTDLKTNEKHLAHSNATKDKFFSIIAHDLKNPFNTLIGISELMINNPEIKDTEDFDELIEGMFQTAKSGYNLLENLLEWSRSQLGNIKLDPQVIFLDEIIASVTTFFRETAKAKEIIITTPENKGLEAYADYNMANFIIRNLINNALKFSHKNTKIEVTTFAKDEMLVIRIKDQGIGMSPGTLGKLFKIEHTVQKDGTANEKGTGLGLILCKEFVEKNEGQIWVESEEGKGSAFNFSLPQKPSYL